MTSSTQVETGTRGRSDLALIAAAIAVVSALAALLLVVAAGFLIRHAYDGKVLPGVRAGAVDVGGLTPADAEAKVASSYASLGNITITLQTPWGTEAIRGDEVGRRADARAMALSAMALGRQGDPFSEGLASLGAVLGGQSVPLQIRFDADTLASRIHAIASAHGVPPHDAAVVLTAGRFSVTPATAGSGIDERAVETEAAASFSTPGTGPIAIQAHEVTLSPSVTDAAAGAALAQARRMAVDVRVVEGSDSRTISAATVAGAIRFGSGANGAYAPFLDQATLRTAVSRFAPSLNSAPVEPIILATSGSTMYVSGGSPGRAVDVDATTGNIVSYLTALGAGQTPDDPQFVVAAAPTQASQSGKTLVAVSKLGSWTVHFDPSIANGFGANIRVPAQYLNGAVVAPGSQFSFLNGVGPITFARGFQMGGVIVNGKSNLTGAIGGGICSASTTLFNAVLRAGLQIDERHNHAYYITRYPAGLDATVFDDTGQVDDMKFTNDMANAVVIRGYSTATSVTFEIWGVPDGRTVKISQGPETGYTPPPPTKTVTVTTLPTGTSAWEEIPAAGFNIWAYRTVTDANGQVLHSDAWYSHYIAVGGLINVGA